MVAAPTRLSILSIPDLDFIAWHRLADERYIAVRFLECTDADLDLFARRECVLEEYEGEISHLSGDPIDDDTLEEVIAEALGRRKQRYWDSRAETRGWARSVAL